MYIDIKTLEKLKEDGKKSYNIKMLEDNYYEAFEIPSKKLRTFMNSDYSSFIKYCEEKFNESPD